jgi:hypothetical protein
MASWKKHRNRVISIYAMCLEQERPLTALPTSYIDGFGRVMCQHLM